MKDLNPGALDRYITGNYGEDQFKDDPYPHVCLVCGRLATDGDFCKDHDDNDMEEE